MLLSHLGTEVILEAFNAKLSKMTYALKELGLTLIVSEVYLYMEFWKELQVKKHTSLAHSFKMVERNL